jgi:hypothetical protein
MLPTLGNADAELAGLRFRQVDQLAQRLRREPAD